MRGKEGPVAGEIQSTSHPLVGSCFCSLAPGPVSALPVSSPNPPHTPEEAEVSH